MKTPRISQLPPFFTHGIGSLPRPLAVRQLLAQQSELPLDFFNRSLDDSVRFAIRLQELAGLDVVSDGEWRRSQYIREFLTRVGGFERCRKYSHQGETKLTEVVVRRMPAAAPVFQDDAAFWRPTPSASRSSRCPARSSSPCATGMRITAATPMPPRDIFWSILQRSWRWRHRL
jgi:5-methyltetrahydropteroyltriglutamate--homocysteine methyltransferase